MNTPSTQHTHPLVITAAIAVIVTCAVAVGSMAGLLPSSRADNLQTPKAYAPATYPAAPVDYRAAPADYRATSESSNPIPENTNRMYAPEPMASTPPAQVVRVSSRCHNCGRVVAVRPIKIQGQASGLGAVAGGLTGALVGKQFGNGKGQTAMTVVGAAGGAMLGHNIEKNQRSKTVYDVVVRFDDGGSSSYRYNSARWHVGERVRVVNGQLRGGA